MLVYWTPLAIDDLQHIRDFVAQDKPVAAQNLVAEIFNAVESLNTMPYRGRPGRMGTRELSVSTYIAKYRVTDQHVEVLRIGHGAQLWM